MATLSNYATWEEKLAASFALPSMPALSIRKVGGLWHWKCGRIGGSLYLAKRKLVVKALPGRLSLPMTAEQAAAYRAHFAQTCDAMTANTW